MGDASLAIAGIANTRGSILVARPREKNISKAGYWKRNQRAGVRSSRCSKCGATHNLIVHHRNKETADNRPSNLKTLCRSCHLRSHPETAAKGGRAS
jgi:5-methylcytosine-specific restriction endonuclease McrA